MQRLAEITLSNEAGAKYHAFVPETALEALKQYAERPKIRVSIRTVHNNSLTLNEACMLVDSLSKP